MIIHHIIQGIFLLTGVIALLASLFNADWFFTTNNARFAVNKFGRNGARWVYGAIGIIFISAAIFFYYQIEQI